MDGNYYIANGLTLCEQLDHFPVEDKALDPETANASPEYQALPGFAKVDGELSPNLVEDKSKWLAAMEKHLKEAQVTTLDLSFGGMGVEEAKSIFRFFPNSQITELSLAENNLSGGMEDLLQALLTSKINKLDIYDCSFSNEELLRLMSVLKDTHVTKLRIWNKNQTEFSADDGNKFVSYLLQSQLTVLDFGQKVNDYKLIPDYVSCYPAAVPCGMTSFLSLLPNTALTSLYLTELNCSRNTLSSLFSNLHNTALVDLSLFSCGLEEDMIKELSLCLKRSKLVRLNLGCNDIRDIGIDTISMGLILSKITSLELSYCGLKGSSPLGWYLRDSQIRTLNLSNNLIHELFSFSCLLKHSSLVTLDMANCGLDDDYGPKLMRSLQFSKVEKLDVSYNRLGILSASEFANVARDTNLTFIDLSCNFFPRESIIVLGECLKDSKLRHVRLRGHGIYHNCVKDPVAFSVFIEKTKECALNHFDLSFNEIGNSALVSLVAQLKLSFITHLNLFGTKLGDIEVECLAKHLKETRLINLDLGGNFITNCGAEFLAVSLKGSCLLQLYLGNNQIENKGIETLAQHAEDTFIIELDLNLNPGTRHLLIERVLLENKTAVHHFVCFFKQIASEGGSFNLESSVCQENVEVFLEKCLRFYKTVTEHPSAVSVLLQEKSLSLSREQIVSFFEEFPAQFASFVANKIEASVTDHVNILQRAEELGFDKIVEFLLLNRPALMIDHNKNILHPFVYKLLRKYKQPLYNTSVEPEGKMRIIQFFSEHSDLEGAVDVVSLLRNDKSS